MQNEIKKLLVEVSGLSFALFTILSIPFVLVFVACACAGAYSIIDWL